MGALATQALSSAPLSDDQSTSIPSDISDIAAIVARFVEAERDASRAYQVAFLMDVPHEQLKDQLTAFVQEFGIVNADRSQRLRVGEFELIVRPARSSRVDHIAVRRFRYALIRDGRGRHGLAAEIFEADMVYTIRPYAREILAGMKLSGQLRDLFDRCEIVSESPILDVSRIVPE